MAQNILSLWLSCSSSNAMSASNILIRRCDYIVLWNHNCLSSHWWGLVSSWTNLHNFLKMRWQLNQRSSDFCLVSVNLKWHVPGCGGILMDLVELIRIVLCWDIHWVNKPLIARLAIVVLCNCFLDYLFALTNLLVETRWQIIAWVCLCWRTIRLSCIRISSLFSLLLSRSYVF